MGPHLLGLILGTLSALCWAGFDVARKRVGEEQRASSAVALLMLLHTPVIASLVAGGVALGAEGELARLIVPGWPDLSWQYALLLSGTTLINVAANLLFVRAVQISPLSLTTPYLSFTPVFTAILSLFVYNEIPTSWGWAGIMVVCLGAFFLNPGERGQGPLAPLKALVTERGSFYMVIVALMWSVTPLFDKSAAEHTSPLWHTWSLSAVLGVSFLIWRLVADRGPRPLLREARARPGWLVTGATCAVGALLLQLGAYAYTEIAYVETIKRAIGVTIAMIAGYLLFGERDITRRLLGALIMVGGVAMIFMLG